MEIVKMPSNAFEKLSKIIRKLKSWVFRTNKILHLHLVLEFFNIFQLQICQRVQWKLSIDSNRLLLVGSVLHMECSYNASNSISWVFLFPFLVPLYLWIVDGLHSGEFLSVKHWIHSIEKKFPRIRFTEPRKAAAVEYGE